MSFNKTKQNSHWTNQNKCRPKYKVKATLGDIIHKGPVPSTYHQRNTVVWVCVCVCVSVMYFSWLTLWLTGIFQLIVTENMITWKTPGRQNNTKLFLGPGWRWRDDAADRAEVRQRNYGDRSTVRDRREQIVEHGQLLGSTGVRV